MRLAWIHGLLTVFLAPAAWAAGPQMPSPWGADSGGAIGRVFYDNDGDGRFGEGDEGLSGIRVTTNSGKVVETGPDGRYHLFLLTTGYEVLASHVIKLDTSTLPSGARIRTPRKLVHLSPASVIRVDFAVWPPMMEAPESKGIEPATKEVPPRLEPTPGGHDILTVLTGKAHPDCRVSVDGKPVEVQGNWVYQVKVAIKPGSNPYFVTIHCKEGHLEFLQAEIHWVTREKGGDLILPTQPRTLATCIGPPLGTIPRSPNVDLSCKLKPGVDLSVGTHKSSGPVETPRTFRARLPVVPGTNTFKVEASFGQAKGMQSTVSWDISPVRLGGALLGSLAVSFGGSGGPVFGGRLRGTMRADFPADFKLILSSGLQTTREEDVSLGNFIVPAWNPWVHQRDPDPDEGYLVPADSAIVSDDAPSSSRYLLRLKRKSSLLGWGGFETHNGQTGEIGTYRRALLGAQAVLHPFEDLLRGPEPAFDLALEGFYASESSHRELLTSEPGIVAIADNTFAAPAHEELLATGGTLYFLGHFSVVEGSERLQVHKRDARTGLTQKRRDLKRGIDYQVDWRSGRILLTEPLQITAFSEGAVRLTSTGGPLATVLVIDYEHLDTDPSGVIPSTAGGRAAVTVHPAEEIRITGAFTAVNRWADTDYRLYKGEANVQIGRTAALWAAYGSSVGGVLLPAYSTDGGLSFAKTGAADWSNGEAYEAGASLDTDFLQGQVLFRHQMAGFADTSLVADRNLTQALATLTARPAQSMDIFGRFAGTEQDSGSLLEGGLGLRFRVSDDLALTAEGVFDQGDGGSFGYGHRALAGLRASWRLVEWLTVTAGHQQTILKDGEGFSSRDLTLSSVGTEACLWERYQVGVEGGWGPEVGNLVRLSLREERGDGGAVFAHTTFSVDHDAVRAGSVSTGQAVPTKEGALVTTTHTFAVERAQSAQGQQVGLKVPLSKPWFLSFAYERAELHNALNQGEKRDLFYSPFFDRGLWDLTRPGRRNAVHARLSYLTGPLVLSASGEYRVDERHWLMNALDLMDKYHDLSTHRQAVFTLAGRFLVTDGFALGGRVAWGETVGENPDAKGLNPIPEGRLLEASLGAAYRPAGLDWFRFLVRLNLGQDSRPPRHPERPYYLDRWLSSTVAVLLRPTRYFQPTLALAPFLYEWRYPSGGEEVRPQKKAFVGMLRIGSEIWSGLGVSAEARVGTEKTEGDIFEYPDVGFKIGAALEIFYQIESSDFGGIRLGLGYSFSDLPDPMTDIRTGQKGLFIRLEGMM